MSDRKQLLCVLLLSTLLLMSPFEATTDPIIPEKERESVPAAIDIVQVIPDPNLDTEPDAFVNGSSGEFSSSYSPGIMSLNWTHDRDTLLTNQTPYDTSVPAYSDFAYFTQSFDWPHEEMPEDAVLHLNYSISPTGGLASSEGADMFRVYAWFIDSSDNWWRIYSSYHSYGVGFFERVRNLMYLDIRKGFEGMIEDASGVQEDPEDTLRLGIGIAPTQSFNNSVDDGSVLIQVTSMNLHVIMRVEPDPTTHLTPLYNETFGSTISQLFPRFVGDTTPVGDNLKAMTTDSDGNIYLTGYISSPYEFYIENGVRGLYQFLIKYDPRLNRQWLVRNTNMTRAYAIAYHDGNIFTTGCFYGYEIPEYADLMLTKWGPGGQKIWEKEWGGDHDQFGIALDVHNDGSIYVMVADQNFRGPEPAYQNSTLLKFDSNGNVLWNKPLPLCTMLDIPGKLWIFESHIIYFMPGILLCMDLNGNVLWEKEAEAAICDENGTVYASVYSPAAAVHRYDLEGNGTLAAYYEIEYPTEWVEWLDVHDLALTQTNQLLVLIQGRNYDTSFHLLKYDLNGTHQQTWSIGNEQWPRTGGALAHMEVTSTGLLYVSFGHMSWDVWTQAFVIGDYTLPPPPSGSPMTIVAIGGGIVVIVLIGVYVYKRKQV